uniref:Retrotransposon gag domain-containing protein n=1 Tax=Tanacetum cinerariifolium TaxID=118510 RepID=A0A699HVV9_TANCI|nr:hypothetical protein [Tanacetum cinerariifolium]
MIERNFVEIPGTFLVKIRENTFNGAIGENVFEHINNFLEVVGLIKINGVSQDRFRLSIFSISLAGAAGEWFKKDCIGSVSTWEDLEEKFIQKFYQLSDDSKDIEAEEDATPTILLTSSRSKAIYLTKRHPCVKHSTISITSLKLTRIYLLLISKNNLVTRDLKEPWSDNGMPYQLCDHICEPYHFKNEITRWPTCSSNIDGFCNDGELPGMVRVGSMTYFQDHKWYDELADGKLKEETLMHKAKVEESWGNATLGVIKLCTWLINSFGNFHELDYNVLVKLQERWDDPTLEPSVCKIKRFKMMKYSFNADEEYIAIKESEYLNHSKDNLDTYRELLHIDEGWVVATPDEE